MVAQLPEGGRTEVGYCHLGPGTRPLRAQRTVELVAWAVVVVWAVVDVVEVPGAAALCPARSGPTTTTTFAAWALATGEGVGTGMTVAGARPRAVATAPASAAKPGRNRTAEDAAVVVVFVGARML